MKALLLLLLPCATPQDDKIEWAATNDLDAVMKAATYHKPVLAVFHSASCEDCRELLSEGFSPAAAKIANERFVPVRIARDECGDVAEKYVRNEHHLLAVISPLGRQIGSSMRYSGPDRLSVALSRFAEAFPLLETASPDSRDSFVRQMSARADTGEWGGWRGVALGFDFKGLLANSKNDPPVRALVALASAREGTPDRALAILETAIREEQENKSGRLEDLLLCRLDRASELRRPGLLSSTCNLALELLPKSPNLDFWHFENVQALLALNRYGEAVAAADRATLSLPETSWGRRRISKLAPVAKRLATALETLESRRAPAKRESWLAAACDLIRAQLDSGLHVQASQFAKALIEEHAKEPRLLGEVFYRVATDSALSAEERREAWKRGLEADPDNASGHLDFFLLRKAQHELSEGEAGAAADTARDALRRFAGSEHRAALWFVVASASLRLGKDRDALQAVEEGLKLNPVVKLRKAFEQVWQRADARLHRKD